MTSASFNNNNFLNVNINAGFGYDPGKNQPLNPKRENISSVKGDEKYLAFAALEALGFGPRTIELAKKTIYKMVVGPVKPIVEWITSDEYQKVFTGEIRNEINGTFAVGYNTGSLMRNDDEERYGIKTFDWIM